MALDSAIGVIDFKRDLDILVNYDLPNAMTILKSRLARVGNRFVPKNLKIVPSSKHVEIKKCYTYIGRDTSLEAL